MEIEIWRNVKGFEGLYKITPNGVVKSIDRIIVTASGALRKVRGRILQSRINNYGYFEVRLSKNGKVKTCFVHRLIAEAFIPNPHSLPIVNHLNGEKRNNSIHNLEWQDQRGNTIHAYQNNLISKRTKPVIDLQTGKTYKSAKEASVDKRLKYNTLRNYLNGNISTNPTSLVYYN